jgi:hypothetical protein
MLKTTSKLTAASFALVSAITAQVPTAAAQDFFPAIRAFRVDNACMAFSKIKTQANPEALTIGQSYAGRGFNRANNPTHVFIKVGEVNKWVAVECGRFTDDGLPLGTAAAGAATGPATGNKAAAQQCLPFFDADDTPTVDLKIGGRVDVTPRPPTLNAFDRALNTTCGAPGKIVAKSEFVALMKAHPAELQRIKTFTGGRVFANQPAPATTDAYVDALADAWFNVKAFDHIFCGEPGAGGGKVGGLHFHGRYQQLQASGDLCRMPNYAQNEVKPGSVYTMGVMMKNANGAFVRDARKGYGLTLSGEDLLKLVTRAFAENGTGSNETAGCSLAVKDDGHAFSAVFARRATGIRTFYPDATPNSRGDRINPKCASEISLQ